MCYAIRKLIIDIKYSRQQLNHRPIYIRKRTKTYISHSFTSLAVTYAMTMIMTCVVQPNKSSSLLEKLRSYQGCHYIVFYDDVLNVCDCFQWH